MARSRKRQVIVVTGASAGVGRATVRAFARQGAALALLARGQDGLQAAKGEVERLGGKALVLPVDVSRADEVEVAAEAVESQLGPIDVWVNCAMVSVFSPISRMKAEEYKRVTEVNYLGYVHGTLSALKRMRPRNRGTIVQVSSALAYRSIPLQSAYCASKHAIAGFTESLRSELIHDESRIHVTMVHLPALNTPQFGWVRSRLARKAQPVPPIFQPEVAARAIVWSAHHRRRALSVGGSVVQAIFGNKVIPGLLDRYLASKGYEGQQTEAPEDPHRPDNLEGPLPGDHGAHGAFDERAEASSPHLWVNLHRGLLAVGGLTLGGAGLLLGGLRPAR